MLNRDAYLEPSPYATDAGHLIGRHPRHLTRDELTKLHAPQSPLKAIRTKCLDCSGGSEAEARKCTAVACPLWAYRMGFGPFHARSTAGQNHEGLDGPSSEAEGI